MTAAALNVNLNKKTVNLFAKEQMTPEYLKINPQHTIPTLVDNGFALWESRAICVYLVEKYGKDDSLYPKDVKTRAVINQRFFFDMGSLFKQFGEYYFAEFFGRTKNPEDLKKFNESMTVFNNFLEPTGYAAGTKNLTLADIVLFASVSCFEVVNVDLSPYPNVQKWLKLMKETCPGRDQNAKGIEILRGVVTGKK